MWGDVIEGIKAGNFTQEELNGIFESHNAALIKDCKSCDYHPKLMEIKKFSKKSAKKIRKSKNKRLVRETALQKAEKILEHYQNLNSSLIGFVNEEAYNQFNPRQGIINMYALIWFAENALFVIKIRSNKFLANSQHSHD